MSVVGFDLGNQSCYVAVARQGGIETVANEYSDRNTPACISYGEKSRAVGASAKQQMISNIRNTVWGWKKLIGRKFADPVVQREQQNLPYKLIETPDGGVGMQVNFMNETTVFTPEQMYATMLIKLQDIAEANLKTKVVDCVLSVPCYYTDCERRAVLDSAKVSGLNCLRLMNDTTATALAYGIYKQDLPAPEEKPRNVIFVDLGHSDLQVAACAFNKGKLKVLATSAHPVLGGRDFDRVLVNSFSKTFLEKYKVDASSSPKATIRLTQECEKLKKLMSANSTALPLNIECFMNDKDVTAKLKRSDMEEMSSTLFAEAKATMQSILVRSSLKLEDIYSVEIVGGSTRVPTIKSLVFEVFGKEPSTTLNADEAVARGCALQCAILSPTLRVRDFSITDSQPYPITLAWIASINDTENDMEVYSQFHQIPFSKMLTFYRQDPFKLEARYSGTDIPHPNVSIGTFCIDKVCPQSNGESSKVKVKVRVNIHGLFMVSSASMVEKLDCSPEEEEQKQEEEVKPESMEVENGPKIAVGSNGEPEPPKGEEPMDTDQKLDDNKDKTAESPKPAGEADKKKEETPPVKKKNKVKTIDLPVTEYVCQMPQNQINALHEKECQMIAQDRLEKERADAKNSVEEYVYEMREKLYSILENFVTEDDRSSLSLKLEDTENWLYDEGEDQTKSVYQEKLTSLKALGQPIISRYQEAEQRPGAFQALGATLQRISKAVEQYRNKDELYEHLEAADMEKVDKCLQEKREWFERYMNQCTGLQSFQDPPVTAANIHQHRQNLENTCYPILNKPKPKPKEEPPKEEPPKDTEVKNGETGTQSEAKADTASEPTPPQDSSSKDKADMDLD